MTDRAECEATLLAQREWLQRTMETVARRRGAGAVDVDDFASWAMLKLIEDDYAILRAFRGDSSLRTYLSVVVATLLREYRVRFWGRWRPSAAARRGGRVAVQLETLVRRDGLPLHHAVMLLRTRGETTLSERELARLFTSLPSRACVGHRELARLTVDAVDGSTADEPVLLAEASAERRDLENALAEALAELAAEDRRLLRMRFWDAMTVADIARRLDVPQKPLYRRIERALVALRRQLETKGISRGSLRSLEVVAGQAA